MAACKKVCHLTCPKILKLFPASFFFLYIGLPRLTLNSRAHAVLLSQPPEQLELLVHSTSPSLLLIKIKQREER